MNDEGEVLFEVGGRKFGLLDKTYWEIECGKEWCKGFGINNLGWVIGHGHNTYPVPPMGAFDRHTFVWANEQLFNLDKSVRRSVNTDYSSASQRWRTYPFPFRWLAVLVDACGGNEPGEGGLKKEKTVRQ